MTNNPKLRFKALTCSPSIESQRKRPGFFRRCGNFALTLACVAAFTCLSPKSEPIFSQTRVEAAPRKKTYASAMEEFTDLYLKQYLPYQKDQKKVNILYPGSGTDTSPILGIGLPILHKSNVDEVHFIFTEISVGGTFGFGDRFSFIKSRIHFQLRQFEKKGLVKIKSTKNKENKWQPKPDPNSRILEFILEINVRGKPKKMTLTLCYDVFEDRKEPTEGEKKKFTPRFIKNAKQNYWGEPEEHHEYKTRVIKGRVVKTLVSSYYSRPLKIRGLSPTYFIQGQFDECDILLSKMCGDGGLLMFDYARALSSTSKKKQRVLLKDNAHFTLKDTIKSLRGYNPVARMLRNNDYGYCTLMKGKCKVGILITK